MKINPIGNGGYPKNRGLRTIAVMTIISLGGSMLISRKDKKK